MTIPENIFDEAVTRLRQGEDVFSVASSYPEYATELEQLLPVATLAMSIPTVTVPVGRKHFKFAEVRTAPYRFGEFLLGLRMAVIPLSLVAALIAGPAIVKAIDNSLPGETLYSLKHASEEVRVGLTFDQQSLAAIHVELTQKRLEEVRKAADSNNPEAETKALLALKEQTAKTFATVPQVAVANAIANRGQSTLLDNLVAINNEQKNVLTNIADRDKTQAPTNDALTTVEENGKTIASLIATVHEQVLADLPNKISVTGEIDFLHDDRISVEKNVFLINADTTITGSDGAKVDDVKTLSGRITIIGTNSDDGLIAKQIIALAPEQKPTPAPTPVPAVKGATTTKPSEPLKAPVQPLQPAVTPPTNQASGTYIVEPTAQQYTP